MERNDIFDYPIDAVSNTDGYNTYATLLVNSSGSNGSDLDFLKQALEDVFEHEYSDGRKGEIEC